jgi:epoxyqueuosine reductase
MQDPFALKKIIQRWSEELGFDGIGVAGVDIKEDEKYLNKWLKNKFHGSMNYMEKHGLKRSRPDVLLPGTIRVISLKIYYFSRDAKRAQNLLENDDTGYISNYALGLDYHKTIKNKLKILIGKIRDFSRLQGQNYFVDTAPVLERALARNAGLGWIGKNTNLIDKSNGSWFFLAEIFTDIPLPLDQPADNHCGSCSACIDICPTQAIVSPYQLDARKCISYQTIENRKSIPIEMRKPIGNRIFGCDDCQTICPWNKFAKRVKERDFLPRSNLLDQPLDKLFLWSEIEWKKHTQETALQRSGYSGWLRNIAVALGNAQTNERVLSVLKSRANEKSTMVKEHVLWALEQHKEKKN